MLGQLHRLMPTTHAERGALGELCADVERMVARIDSPLAAFLTSSGAASSSPTRRRAATAARRTCGSTSSASCTRRIGGTTASTSRATPSREGVYDEPFRQRGLRVETATRVDPEHGGEATCAWLVGVALRDDAERPMVRS